MSELRTALARRVTDARRLDGYYLEVLAFAEACLASARARPSIIGVSGPQGSGKSTLAAALVGAFSDTGVRAISISIDDFYLTRTEQLGLAARHPGNPTLEHRGYPGTHDVALGARVLGALRSGSAVRIPSYDKSAHGGRGDRAPESAWREIAGAVDLVFLEGWMLGFTPVGPELATGSMRAPDELLAQYSTWDAFLDAFVLLEAADTSFIVEWRVDAERSRRARGETALTDDEARDYIDRFIPAYELYVPQLRIATPGSSSLRLVLGEDRLTRIR